MGRFDRVEDAMSETHAAGTDLGDLVIRVPIAKPLPFTDSRAAIPATVTMLGALPKPYYSHPGHATASDEGQCFAQVAIGTMSGSMCTRTSLRA